MAHDTWQGKKHRLTPANKCCQDARGPTFWLPEFSVCFLNTHAQALLAPVCHNMYKKWIKGCSGQEILQKPQHYLGSTKLSGMRAFPVGNKIVSTDTATQNCFSELPGYYWSLPKWHRRGERARSMEAEG
uniref:Uncharacterized protein n=1 Tax=Sphaerodactylus townsendi TaxID=933632 RepID=A0ACB8EZQ4_9SAUR